MILMLIGQGNAELAPQEIDIFKVLPYITILVLAVSGLNVFIVLSAGIVLAGFTGFMTIDYSVARFANDIFDGFKSMQ